MKDRVYIFLDKNLSNPQKIVQATHLGIESNRLYPSDIHPSVIVLAVDLSQLESIKVTLNKRGIKFTDFYEPIFDSVTGLATEPISKEMGKYLQHFPTIKDKDFIKAETQSQKPNVDKFREIYTSLNTSKYKLAAKDHPELMTQLIKDDSLLPTTRGLMIESLAENSQYFDFIKEFVNHESPHIRESTLYALQQLSLQDSNKVEEIFSILNTRKDQESSPVIKEVLDEVLKIVYA